MHQSGSASTSFFVRVGGYCDDLLSYLWQGGFFLMYGRVCFLFMAGLFQLIYKNAALNRLNTYLFLGVVDCFAPSLGSSDI